MADSGYDVVTENRYFVNGADIEWEELSFSVNGAKWGADRPPFPLLQAEKVLSLPLQLRFDTDYRYELRGTEVVNEFDCYVIEFEPVVSGKALYRGTVWIDRTTFARVRVQTVQSGLPARSCRMKRAVLTPSRRCGGPLFCSQNAAGRSMVAAACSGREERPCSELQVNQRDFARLRTLRASKPV